MGLALAEASPTTPLACSHYPELLTADYSIPDTSHTDLSLKQFCTIRTALQEMPWDVETALSMTQPGRLEKRGGSTKHLSKTTQEVQGSLSQHKGGGIKPAAAMRWSLRGWGWVGNCGVVGSQLCYII